MAAAASGGSGRAPTLLDQWQQLGVLPAHQLPGPLLQHSVVILRGRPLDQWLGSTARRPGSHPPAPAATASTADRNSRCHWVVLCS